MIILSCFLTWAFMFGSAFCTALVQVFIVQCAATGAAIGLGTPMYMALPSQWFLKKRGLATGMVGGGTGIGSAVATLILRQLCVFFFATHSKWRDYSTRDCELMIIVCTGSQPSDTKRR